MFDKILGRYRKSEEEKNLDELEAMTDEEIEEAIQDAFAKIKEGFSAEEEKNRLELKTMVEGWSAIEAGYNFCFVSRKEGLWTVFAACPDLMAKKIEEAKTIYADIPPVYLKFAKRWKEQL